MLISKKSKIFIAGHNGMVGSAIKRSLNQKGYKNLLCTSRNDLNLLNFEEVKNWFNKNKPEVVILAAAKVGGIQANSNYSFDFILENLKIQNNVLENAWKYNVKRFLFLGSSCIYPKYSKLPIKEEELLKSYLEKTNESYAIAKITGIKLCEAIRKQHNFDAISLMPTNLYGPGDNYHSENSHVLASLIKKFVLAKRNNIDYVTCWGSGKPIREFLHVDDLAEACIHVLEKWNPEDPNAPKDKYGDKLYYLNVGSGEEISINQLAQLIAKLTKYNKKIIWDTNKPDGTFRKNLDSTRIRSLGWIPKIKLNLGIKKTIQQIELNLADPEKKIEFLKNF